MKSSFCLAHLSDPHLSQPNPRHLTELANKRILGFLSWHLRRRHEHRREILAALTQDLKRQTVDHTVITGDLTQIGLADEHLQVAQWLSDLGDPHDITVIPGNHDHYVSTSWQTTFALWQAYFHSGPSRNNFPVLRRRGPVALIGLDSSPPSAPFLATGKVGKDQCRRLASCLKQTVNRFRIVLIHHPPHREAVKRRKSLTDTDQVIQVLHHHGCGMVLHGHSHYWQLHWLTGPGSPIPVIGVPSASARGLKRGYRARYHLYRIQQNGEGWVVRVEIRGLDPDEGRFLHEGQFQFSVSG